MPRPASTSGTAHRFDWAQGPAKYAAVGVLGLASIVGISWSILGRQSRPILEQGDRILKQDDQPELPAAPGSPSPSGPKRDSARSLAARPINLNAASAQELQMLPGIGPALAARIIEDREKNGPYASIEQLDRVKGIGPRTIEKLRGLAGVE